MALRLSDSTAQLIRALLERPGLFQRLKPPVHSHIELISRIESAREVASVPYLILYLLNADAESQQRAAQAVESLIGRLRAVDLLNLDQELRRYDAYSHTIPNWTEIKPSQLERLDGSPVLSGSVLGVLSFHSSGYVREAAVRGLASVTTGQELPYLLIRLNDWVGAVRVVARHAVQDRMRPDYTKFFAENIYLIDRLAHWERVDHAQFLRWIMEYLKAPECQNDLVTLLQSPDVPSRRLIYRLLAGPATDELPSLLQQGLGDKDPAIRLWAIREVRARLKQDALYPLLNKAIKDRFAAIRAQAAYGYVERLSADTAPLLRRLLVDPNASLRSIGRYYLAKVEECDFPAFYRSRLEERAVTNLPAAIYGLSEVGGATDADCLLPFLQHPRVKIAAAALRGLARLDPERFIPIFEERLLNGSPSESREAAPALSSYVNLIDTNLLWKEFQRASRSVTRKRILQVLFSAAKWDRLFYVLATYTETDPTIVQQAQNGLRRWLQQFNRQASQPTKEQQLRALRQVEKVATILDPSTVQTLRFLIGPANS